MAETIHVNGKSNSLAHKGCMGFAKSTLPDVCKTPSPGGPVPIPYPVIVSLSNDLKKGSKNVKFDGNNSAAIKGSEYSRCTGDEPGTAGGVKSSTNMKEATWILYSFDVKIEGKNACRLSDKMMMNHKNTACLSGFITDPVTGDVIVLECGECGSYSELQKKAAAPKYERDHVPSKASLLQAAKSRNPNMTPDEIKCVKAKVTARGITIAIPKPSHRGYSPTCGSKNTSVQIKKDAKNLAKARDRDLAAMMKHLKETDPECHKAYKKAARKVRKHDNNKMIRKAVTECTGG